MHEALSCSVWIDSHVDMFGLGLIYVSRMVVEMHTWSPDWKRVVIVVFIMWQACDCLLQKKTIEKNKVITSVQAYEADSTGQQYMD